MNLSHHQRAFFLGASYLVFAYICGIILKASPDFQGHISNLPGKQLALINAVLIATGIPASAIIDILLINKLGLNYIAIWPLIVGIISAAQVNLIRNNRQLFFHQKLETKSYANLFALACQRPRVTVLFIRSIPITPFIVGSLLIAKVSFCRAREVLFFSSLGSYIYYLFFGLSFLIGAQ